jgi:hypothetical protein
MPVVSEEPPDGATADVTKGAGASTATLGSGTHPTLASRTIAAIAARHTPWNRT